MNDKGERIWKEAVVAEPMYYYDICLEGLRKTMTSIASAPVEIPAEHLQVTRLDILLLHRRFTYRQPLNFMRHDPVKAYGGGEAWLHTFICRISRRSGIVSYSGGSRFESRSGKQLS
jgi:hypothetical protein